MRRTISALLVGACALLLSACWTQFHGDAAHTGFQPLEGMINASNVSALHAAGAAPGFATTWGSASVVGNEAYLNSDRFWAYDVSLLSQCTGDPLDGCPAQKWIGAYGGGRGTPAIAGATVYVTSDDHNVYAYSTSGVTDCVDRPGYWRVCQPLWRGVTQAAIDSSPTVDGGILYVTSVDGLLYAFDANGNIGCGGTPRTCAPLWTAATQDWIFSSPTVANGYVYVASTDQILYAFDATGRTRCGGTPKVCSPVWTAALHSEYFSTPAVQGGKLYIGAGNLEVFDAAGVVGCTGSSPRTCTPLWTGNVVAGNSSPAVANGVVYVGGTYKDLYTFDANGSNGCGGAPKTCAPLWTGPTGGPMFSSPAVANGVVYTGSDDGRLYAFDAQGIAGCGGAIKSCAPLKAITTGTGPVKSSPSIAAGRVYVAGGDADLHVYSLTP